MNKRLPRAPKFEYPPVGRCIYCCTTGGKLTHEHIIPYGLNGNFVLPESSCTGCAEITSKVELSVLRGFLENGRRAMGVTSRHKKNKKAAAVPVKFIIGEVKLDGEMPIEDGFHAMHFPIFAKPLVLGGEAKDNRPDSIDVVGFYTFHVGDVPRSVYNYYATGIETQTELDIWSFIRMLAKIAYSYYVAEKGVFPRVESPILPIAMNEHSYAKKWIGCLEDYPLTKQASKALHLLDITEIKGDDDSICSVVRIKLFSVDHGPTYSVVVRIQMVNTHIQSGKEFKKAIK